jgi:hypothetical protein
MTIMTQPIVESGGYDVYRIFQMFGGLNLEDSVDNIKDIETDDMMNVITDEIGSRRKRRGNQKVNATALNSGAAITGGREVDFKGGSTYVFIAAQNKVYEKDGTTYTDITGAATITNDDDNLMSSDVFLDTIYMAFRSGDGLFKRDSTGAANIAAVTTPNNDAKLVIKYKNRLWVVEASEPNLLYPSDVDAETFTAGNAVNMDSDDGDEIVGLAVDKEELVVFKKRRIYRISHTRTVPAFAKREVARGQGIGSASHSSITQVENFRNQGLTAVLFRGADNYYSLVGDTPIPIGNRIKKRLQDYNRARAEYVSAGTEKDLSLIYWSESTGPSPTHNRIWAYNWIVDQWFPLDMAFNAYIQHVETGEPQLWGGQYDGFLVQSDVGESDASVVDQSYDSGSANRAFGSDPAANDFISQGFKPGVTDDIARVQVKLKIGAGTPTGNINCHIYSDSSGEPGTRLYTSTTTLLAASLTSAYTFFEFLFAPDSELTSGTQYHLVLAFDTADASNYVAWKEDTSGSYASGTVHTSGDSSTWTEVAASDVAFKTFMGSAAISSYFTTARLDVADPGTTKHWARMLIVAESMGDWDVDVYMRTDFSSTWTSLGTINTAGGDVLGSTWVLGTSELGKAVAIETWIDLSITGKRIQLKFENNNANEPFNIYAIIILHNRIGVHA